MPFLPNRIQFPVSRTSLSKNSRSIFLLSTLIILSICSSLLLFFLVNSKFDNRSGASTRGMDSSAPQHKTKFAILYTIAHCRNAQEPIFDITKVMNGQQQWGPIGKGHWRDEPLDGYYCLSKRPDVLRKHAQLLADAGIDFVVIDSTNWGFADDVPMNSQQDIQEPLTALYEVWSQVENAPKIVIWLPVHPHNDNAPPSND